MAKSALNNSSTGGGSNVPSTQSTQLPAAPLSAQATSTPSWPNAANTGLPAGVTLTPSGSINVTKAGTVLSGLDIKGTIYIDAPNVTVTNCKVTDSSFALIQIALGVSGTVIQNCELNGKGINNKGADGISGQGTFTGNNIYNVENGINVTGSSTITGNYIHGLMASDSPHYDGIQIDGGVTNISVTHNTIVNDYDQTSAIMIDNGFGPVENINIDDNLLAGGGYTVYNDGTQGNGAITGVSFTNNHLGQGYWGYSDFNATNPAFTGNVDDGWTLLNNLAQQGPQSPQNPPVPTVPPSASTPAIAAWSPDTGVSGDGITNSSDLVLDGSATARSLVSVYDGLTLVGQTTSSSSSAWTFAIPALSDGPHVFTATDTASGVTSNASDAVKVIIDTKAPAAPVETSQVVNGAQVILKGAGEANATINVYDGANLVGTTAAVKNGAWSITTSALSAGSHSLSATATDAAGNISAPSTALDAVIGPSSPTVSTNFAWPNAGSSGLPAAVTLTPSGSIHVTRAGTVLSGLDIKGTIYIDAPDVTVLNCKVTSPSFALIQIAPGVSGAVVQNCELDGTGVNNDGSDGISGQGTFSGNNIYNVENGINITGSSTINDNFIHNLLSSGSENYNGIKIDGGVSNVVITHNTIINQYGQTSAIMIDNGFGAVNNITVDNNLLAGGGYTVYDDGTQGTSAITGVSFTNNHMGQGSWGYTDFNATNPNYAGNVDDGWTLVNNLNQHASAAPTKT